MVENNPQSPEILKWKVIIENLFKAVSAVPSDEDLGMSAFHNGPQCDLAWKLKVADSIKVVEQSHYISGKTCYSFLLQFSEVKIVSHVV